MYNGVFAQQASISVNQKLQYIRRLRIAKMQIPGPQPELLCQDMIFKQASQGFDTAVLLIKP